MRFLVIGGTRFVGRHIVAAALAAGHDVTLFHRGKTGTGLFPEADHRTGDRDGDLAGLADGSWDATVDTCAYLPGQVHALADALDQRGGRYALVSSVSAYAAPAAPGFGADSPLVELADPGVTEVTPETYGGLKVLCERAATLRFGAGTLIVRPTYVVGPDDYTWRFPWWATRMARGGDVLAPSPGEDPAQIIDVRDLASWVVSLVRRQVGGAFHAVGPSQPWTWRAELTEVAAAVGPPGTTLTWVDEEFLLAQGLADGSLPLWSGGQPGRLVLTADPDAALAAGLRLRPLAETVRDTLEWATRELATGQSPPPGTGLDPVRETELLARWSARKP